MIELTEASRIEQAKKAFVVRNVPESHVRLISSDKRKPNAGDLLLAEVIAIGNHKALELTTGRRSTMHVGDEIIVAYGNRYAPDQYEALLPEDMSDCDLVAAGGIASKALHWSSKISAPTRIRPIGLLCKSDGRSLNVADFAIRDTHFAGQWPPVIAVVGGSMNAGKTTTAVSLIQGLKRLGHRVGSAKITGTGAGGDLWKMRDAGAAVALDFTDAGMATTYKAPLDQLETAAVNLLHHLVRESCSAIVVEIADGIYQSETASLVKSERLKNIFNGYVYAAEGATGAATGVPWLRQYGEVLAVSGLVTASPLASREAESITGLKCYNPAQLAQGEVIKAWLQASEYTHAGNA